MDCGWKEDESSAFQAMSLTPWKSSVSWQKKFIKMGRKGSSFSLQTSCILLIILSRISNGKLNVKQWKKSVKRRWLYFAWGAFRKRKMSAPMNHAMICLQTFFTFNFRPKWTSICYFLSSDNIGRYIFDTRLHKEVMFFLFACIKTTEMTWTEPKTIMLQCDCVCLHFSRFPAMYVSTFFANIESSVNDIST